jgi:hypothetical protein
MKNPFEKMIQRSRNKTAEETLAKNPIKRKIYEDLVASGDTERAEKYKKALGKDWASPHWNSEKQDYEDSASYGEKNTPTVEKKEEVLEEVK